MVLGLAITGVLCYLGLSKVPHHEYCPVLMEDFTSPTLNTKIWNQEVNLGGFGRVIFHPMLLTSLTYHPSNGEFQETTATGENAFIRDGNLILKPTLQDQSLLTTNSILDLTTQGCTGTTYLDCHAVTNTTNGTIINPVKSARLNTLNTASIRYGRVEVVAKLPEGDWLWPAIWMLPVNNTYGPWPASGEIDIMESRGNNASYKLGGYEAMHSTLHWGPDAADDRYIYTTGSATALHSTFAAAFHTYGLEWSEKYLFTYLDNRLNQVYYAKFSQSFWHRGWFPPANAMGMPFVDPWSQTGNDATPFDQDFYLILSLGVGGTNTYFPDGNGKPWVNESPMAMKQFWEAQDEWYPTWKDGGEFVIKSVTMSQQRGVPGKSWCQ